MKRVSAAQFVRLYVLILGAGLLLEGLALLVVDRLHLELGILASDTRHNLLHVVWGIALLAVAGTTSTRTNRPIAWAAVVFGLFYIALGILGIVVLDPFGLLLGLGENAFHLFVGPLALGLGLWALLSRSQRATGPARSRTAARADRS